MAAEPTPPQDPIAEFLEELTDAIEDTVDPRRLVEDDVNRLMRSLGKLHEGSQCDWVMLTFRLSLKDDPEQVFDSFLPGLSPRVIEQDRAEHPERSRRRIETGLLQVALVRGFVGAMQAVGAKDETIIEGVKVVLGQGEHGSTVPLSRDAAQRARRKAASDSRPGGRRGRR